MTAARQWRLALPADTRVSVRKLIMIIAMGLVVGVTAMVHHFHLPAAFFNHVDHSANSKILFALTDWIGRKFATYKWASHFDIARCKCRPQSLTEIFSQCDACTNCFYRPYKVRGIYCNIDLCFTVLIMTSNVRQYPFSSWLCYWITTAMAIAFFFSLKNNNISEWIHSLNNVRFITSQFMNSKQQTAERTDPMPEILLQPISSESANAIILYVLWWPLVCVCARAFFQNAVI